MHNFGKVAVLMGGTSSEREISLISGQAVVEALRSQGVDAHPFDPAEQSIFDLKKENYDRAFNILHGSFGEDGQVQAILNYLQIPYTGCGVMSSAIGMDKYRTKLIWKAVGLPVPDCVILHDGMDFAAVEEQLGLPMFVKPAEEGSSVGVTKVKEAGILESVYLGLKQYKGEIIAEKFVGGGEFTCGVLGETALPSIHIIPAAEFYDYDAKYFRDDTTYLCPADLNAEDEQHLRELAVAGYKAIGGKGWGRVDFLRDTDGKFYLLEVNTLPGMTSHSLVPKAAAEIGIPFPDLCVEILRHARVE